MQAAVQRHRRRVLRMWRGAVAALMATSLLWLLLSIIPQYHSWQRQHEAESYGQDTGDEEEGLGLAAALRRGLRRRNGSTTGSESKAAVGEGAGDPQPPTSTSSSGSSPSSAGEQEGFLRSGAEVSGSVMDAGKVDDDGSLREGVTRAGGDVEAGEGDAGNEFADRRYRGHVFYYPWYDNPEHNKNKEYLHWNHDILPNPYKQGSRNGDAYVPPEQIGANFYPQLGCYSSVDRELMRKHMAMIRKAGLGVLTVSWYPPAYSDGQIRAEPGFSDSTMRALLDVAHEHGLKINMHVEPYASRSETSLVSDIRYVIDQYGYHPAFYRHHRTNLPMFYVYDSYLTDYKDWAKVLGHPEQYPQSIRKTEYDAMVIALFVGIEDYQRIPQGHFDGVYTYFATDRFTHGSTITSWPRIAKWAKEKGLIFIPSIGPGYNDTRIRPWNANNARAREEGRYYDRMMGSALNLDPPPEIISITSWNEWHEGTQIEPAIAKVAKAIPGHFEEYRYIDYSPHEPEHYLTMTAQWMAKFAEKWQAS